MLDRSRLDCLNSVTGETNVIDFLGDKKSENKTVTEDTSQNRYANLQNTGVVKVKCTSSQ